MRKDDIILSNRDVRRRQFRIKSFGYSYLKNMVDLKGRCLSMIFKVAVNPDELLLHSPIENHKWSGGKIGAQFSLGMPLTPAPQQESGYEQRDGKQGHYGRAEGHYFGVVFSDKLKNATNKIFFALVLVFFFSGPLIGFALLFLNRWIGGIIMLGWQCLIWYSLSGLWR